MRGHAIGYDPWWLRATAGVHGSIRWPIDRCAPRHIPCGDAAVGADGHRSSAAAVERFACRLVGSRSIGWHACTHSHTPDDTDTLTHAHTGASTQNLADTCAHAARMQTLIHSDTHAHARLRRLRGTARRQQRVAGGNRTPSSCGSDARESGRSLLLLVCVAPASRVRRTRRCPQQTSAGSDVARETSGVGPATARTMDRLALALQRYGVAPVGSAV